MRDLHSLQGRGTQERLKKVFIACIFSPALFAITVKHLKLTCFSYIHKEFSHFVSVCLHQAFAESFDSAGLADLWLTNHDLERAVGYMHATLPHAHFMFTDLLRGEGDTCEQEKLQGGGKKSRQRTRKMKSKCISCTQQSYLGSTLLFSLLWMCLSHRGVCWAVS